MNYEMHCHEYIRNFFHHSETSPCTKFLVLFPVGSYPSLAWSMQMEVDQNEVHKKTHIKNCNVNVIVTQQRYP